MKNLKSFSWGYVLLGVLLSVIGICFISLQDAYTALAITMGIILILVGIGFLVNALINKKRGVLFGLKIALAVICVVCGTVTALTRESAILVIANVFFLLLIVDGAFKLQLSILSRRFSFFGWWIILSLSVALIVSAFLMTKFTPENEVTLTVLSGILFIADGITNVLSAFWSTALTRRIDEKDRALEESGADREEEGEEAPTPEASEE